MRALVFLCVCAAAGASFAAVPPATPQLAAWVPHEVLVQYQNLPVAYTCDALWYKVGDILRAVGAWTYVSITPRDCKPQTSGDGLSPTLSVHFLALETLAPSAARWAQTHAVIRQVDLRAGNPKSLDTGDCELLRQTRDDLLSLMGAVQLGNQDLQCRARPASYHFDLSVRALQAVPALPAFVARSPAGR